MHLAAQYLRVALLFFSYGDKRFLVSAPVFDSRNFSSLPARMSAFPHPPVSFLSSTGHTIRAPSVHLSQITSVSISFLFSFVFFSLRVHKSSFKPFSHESKVQVFWQKQKHWQAFELRNKNLPRCALCKRDILLRMRGGARKLRWHCAVIWTAVQKQRSECWFKRGVRRVGEKHLPTLPALTQWGQD